MSEMEGHIYARIGAPKNCRSASPISARPDAPDRPGDYRKATQRIHHSPGQASFVELPLVVAR
jgi:hypothetical protein